MARAPDARMEQAKALFLKGKKLIEISELLGVPEGTIRSWKNRYNWDNATLQKKRNVAKEKSTSKTVTAQDVVLDVKSVIQNPDLSDKQRLFCLYYVRCFNATKAYQKAYKCSYECACGHGHELLKNVEIRNEINRLKQSRLNREFLDEHDIFQKYMDIAFADITDYVEFGREKVQVMGAFGPVEVKNPETGKKEPLLKEVNTVRFRESGEVDGTLISEVKQGKDGASIKLLDRMKALDWLAEHMNIATEEQKARIAQIKAQTEKLKGSDSSAELERLDEVLKEIKGVV